MKKQFFIACSLLIIIVLLVGCTNMAFKYKDYSNAVLVLEQYPKNGSDAKKQGIIYATSRITWVDNIVTNVLVSATFENEAQAKELFQSVKSEQVEAWLDGNILNYYISPEVWQIEGTTYLQALEFYKDDPYQEWVVLKEYEP